ncbi:endoglucanase [Sporothrix schenckii 1099-18]|uniref:lytic cellulose monooxygenase (C4-dehydrogenating) n=1 Tax=Sporothrix schenckii 1099-18 TaxID=1397361 RepID=A0A0F2MGL7_SPOSC|nr:endoglucanase [Sporothrix schenckii 1099-18]KJR88777.1 endoglucanase [Sporothrix schenckii 1099-18]
MPKLNTLALAVAVAFATTATAHTSFTTLFVNGVDQGDGTCVRQPTDPQTSTFPVEDLASSDMICGRNGLASVAFTCPVGAGSTLTFEFRENPDGSAPGAIDKSHKGPCAVYLRQVSDMASETPASSTGWFKIYEDGYDNSTDQWCTEKLITTNGLLSVALPSGLPAGAYLVRPELLALHEAQKGDPQFYVGCAQIFVAGTSSGQLLTIPEGHEATIPGHVKAGDPSVTFNIYTPAFPYPMPGPAVFFPMADDASDAKANAAGNNRIDASSSSSCSASSKSNKLAVAAQHAGVAFVPSACLIKNANWCGVEVPSYTTEAGCWDASENCFHQEAACYSSAPPSGDANCDVWDKKCTAIQAACGAGSFVGPPNAGQPLQQVEAAVPGPIPGAERRKRR